MTNLFYDRGYQDAIIDLQNWFGQNRELLPKRNKLTEKIVSEVLSTILKCWMRFQNRKNDFDVIPIPPKDKKGTWHFVHCYTREECIEIMQGSSKLGDALFLKQYMKIKDFNPVEVQNEG